MQVSLEHSLRNVTRFEREPQKFIGMRYMSLFFSITARRHFGTQDRTRYCLLPRKHRARGASLTGNDVMNSYIRREDRVQMVSEKDGGLRWGWNVPCWWIWRPCFALGSFQKMGHLFLCCNVRLRTWPSVRGKQSELGSISFIAFMLREARNLEHWTQNN